MLYKSLFELEAASHPGPSASPISHSVPLSRDRREGGRARRQELKCRLLQGKGRAGLPESYQILTQILSLWVPSLTPQDSKCEYHKNDFPD
jgi:hypothetical protein